MTQSFDLIVVSHLRWSFVWQRPQQLLSRLARDRRILFVEEPVFSEDAGTEVPTLEQVAPNVTVLAPRIPHPDPNRPGAPVWGEKGRISQQVRQAIEILGFRQRALWFYTPLPEFLLHAVEPDLVIYDVMDELSMFRFAPPELKDQEARLLRRSDIVFTGGASLFESKRPYNKNTHLFASGVDANHYSKACDATTKVPDFVKELPSPVATYIGVIDERLDYDIIAGMAAARPDVQFLMCGPVVKVDPKDLPQAPNLHYPGQQKYDDLPCILKGSDICLMPFARNDATKFISPTKTLEYMATHRPIVSTPIRDVERFYSDIVYLASDASEFARQVDVALNEHPADRARRRLREEKILAEHAWDAIAANMNQLMEDAYARKTDLRTTADVRLQLPRSVRSSVSSSPLSGGQ
jgi:glycosyltransferase involved in cell wall biosynthesis